MSGGEKDGRNRSGDEARPRPEPGAEPFAGADGLYAFADYLQADQEHEEEEAEEIRTWVAFRLAARRLALPVESVQEIRRVEEITRVPRAPSAVRGVTGLRGQVLPVVDLMARLGLGEVEIGEASRILVMVSRGRLIGLLVDAAERVAELGMSRVEPVPDGLPGELPRLLDGVFRDERGPLLLLAAERLLRLEGPEGLGDLRR